MAFKLTCLNLPRQLTLMRALSDGQCIRCRRGRHLHRDLQRPTICAVQNAPRNSESGRACPYFILLSYVPVSGLAFLSRHASVANAVVGNERRDCQGGGVQRFHLPNWTYLSRMHLTVGMLIQRDFVSAGGIKYTRNDCFSAVFARRVIDNLPAELTHRYALSCLITLVACCSDLLSPGRLRYTIYPCGYARQAI